MPIKKSCFPVQCMHLSLGYKDVVAYFCCYFPKGVSVCGFGDSSRVPYHFFQLGGRSFVY